MAPPVDLVITALAAGGDGVARDANGRVTFVPLTAPGDRVRARIVHATSSFARAELVEVLAAGPTRVEPACRHVKLGCGGCQWQQVALPEQLLAKQSIVAGALRTFEALVVHPIASPSAPLGWRRRARFHVARGHTGLYAHGSKRLVPIDRCPQLEPALADALVAVAAASPPDGELALLAGHDGKVVVATERAWRGANLAIGRAGIVGVLAGGEPHGEPVLEIEPGLSGGPWEFAQANAAGNAALIARTLDAIGSGPGRLVELYAGGGNITRALLAAGWDVTATDVVAPARAAAARFEVGPVVEVLGRLDGPVDAIVLDPPRSGAADAVDGILRLAPRTIAYVACDPATLARDVARLVAGGYRASVAWPIDLMPQTSHVEVVMRIDRGSGTTRTTCS